MYSYGVKILKVVDGDTLNVEVDLGLDIKTNLTVRIYGVNAPEMKTPEGVAAKAFVVQWLADREGKTLILNTVKDHREKYGRYLGDLMADGDTATLGRSLLDSGHAVIYFP